MATRPTSTTPGNTTLGLADQAAQTLNTWQGAAATSFATYLNLFQQVVGNQALATEVLRMTLLMEKEMWTRLRGDVVDVRQELRQRLPRGAGFHAGDLKAVLKVAGSVNTILGWFPAFKPATEVAGKALTVTGLIVDTFGGKEPPPNDLGARHFRDILPKMKTHAGKLKETSQTVEGDIKKSLREPREARRGVAARAVERHRRTRSRSGSTVPSGTYTADETSDFIYPGVVVNSKNVRNAASILDTDIAPGDGQRRQGLNEGDSAWQWIRDDAAIGVGTFGCYSEYSAASYSLQKEIADTVQGDGVGRGDAPRGRGRPRQHRQRRRRRLRRASARRSTTTTTRPYPAP